MLQGGGVDLASYPIDRLESAEGRSLVASVRAELDQSGCALLPNFMRSDVLTQIQAWTRVLAQVAHFNQTWTNPYCGDDDPSLPHDHPRRTFMERTNGFVAGDLIGKTTPLRALYHDPAFKRFIAKCVGVEMLYEYADDLADLVVNVLRPGCQHPWHFDNSDFVVSLMVQPAAQGGMFEYCPHIRSRQDENYDSVAAVLGGKAPKSCRLSIRPGDLQIFHGRNSLHRVTRVEGEQERYSLILAYSDRPGLTSDPARTMRLFDRTAEASVKGQSARGTEIATAPADGESQ